MERQNIFIILLNKLTLLFGYRLVKKGYIANLEEYFWAPSDWVNENYKCEYKPYGESPQASELNKLRSLNEKAESICEEMRRANETTKTI
jgi:hypothetical protein